MSGLDDATQVFGRRLYELMMAKGWNQSELARRAGLERHDVSYYIRGGDYPTPRHMKGLAAALGVTPRDLIPGYVERP